MKLTKEDKQILLKMGHPEEDFWQIEEASKVTIYKEYDGKKWKRISAKRVIELVGREKLLAGLGRSAFHGSGSADSDDSKIEILVDNNNFLRIVDNKTIL